MISFNNSNLWLLLIFLLIANPIVSQNVKILGEKELQLDNETAYPFALGGRFQYCRDINAIAYLNRLTRSIKYFDYQTGNMLSIETELPFEGPNGFGMEPNYFYYHNKDSIFLLSGGTNFKMFLLNSQGQKLNTYHYNSDGYKGVPFPKTSRTFGALLYKPPYMMIAVHIGKNRERNNVSPIIKLDLRKDSFEYLKEPKAYKKLDLDRLPGSNQPEFYLSSIADSHLESQYLVSFPMEHDLMIVSNEGSRKVNARSSLVGQFKFLKRDLKTYAQQDFPLLETIINSARYLGILYNPYLNLYYRIGKVEGNKEELRRSLKGEKVKRSYQYLVTVFDSELEFISERLFGFKDAYFERGVFISPEGLWTLSSDSTDEDKITLKLIGFED